MNTYQQAAEKLGISVWMIRQMVATRRMSRIKLGHRTMRIEDSEIERIKARATRRAL